MATSSFTDAPSDIVSSIAEYMDLDDLLHLRLTCHALSAIVSPLALRSISIAIDTSEEHVKRTLRLSFEQLPGIYQYAKHLTIKTHGWYVSRWVDRIQIANVYNTIEQLKSLTSLNIVWQVGHNDENETTTFLHEIQEKVVEAALKSTGGWLSALAIESWRQKDYSLGLPCNLVKFCGLKSLTFVTNKYGCWPRYRPDQQHPPCVPSSYAEGLQTLVLNNPQLEYLSIEHGCAANTHDARTLLAISGKRTLALRALKTKGVAFPIVITAHPSPFSRLQELEVLSTYSSLPLNNLWFSLLAAKTELTKLMTCQVSLPLVTYISSYSGLRELVISNIEDRSECGSYELARLFFTDALPRHSSSLATLTISLNTNIDHLDGWSFTPSLWMPALPKLQALRSLSLYPGDEGRFYHEGTEPELELGSTNSETDNETGDQEQASEDPKTIPITRNYQEVLTSIELLQDLEVLYIIWPNHSIGCRAARMQWFYWSCRLLNQVSKKLRSKTGCPKRLRLQLMSAIGTYNSQKCENCGYWGYVPREAE